MLLKTKTACCAFFAFFWNLIYQLKEKYRHLKHINFVACKFFQNERCLNCCPTRVNQTTRGRTDSVHISTIYKDEIHPSQ